MKTLYDLSLYNYCKRGLNVYRTYGHDTFNINTLIKYHVTNYGDLAEYIKSGNKDFQSPALLMAISEASKSLTKINSKSFVDKNYKFDAYESSEFDESALYKTDLEVDSYNLAVSAVTNTGRSLKDRIRNVSIYDTREMLKGLDLNGKNAMTCSIASIGSRKIEIIANALYFYEEQILRAARITNNPYEQNLFFMDADKKKNVVLERYNEIINFLVTHGDTLICDEMSTDLKRPIIGVTTHSNSTYARLVKSNIVDLIRYYSTLEELEKKDLGPTLKRFIVK